MRGLWISVIAAWAVVFGVSAPSASQSLAVPPPPQPPEGAIVIHAGGVLADPGEAPLTTRTIVVRDGRIAAVEAGYRPVEGYGRGARLIDLKDRFVLPGLIDLHVHLAIPLNADPETLASRERLALATAASAREMLETGVTTVRDTGDNSGVIFAVRDAINAGRLPGPTIYAAGRIISRTGGHGAKLAQAGEVPFTPGGCDSPEACRRVVFENVEAGSDWIKITVSGSGGEATGRADAAPIMAAEDVWAVTEAARRVEKPVVAHAHSVAAINLALEAGARTIDHGAWFDESSVRLFKARGAFLVPTAYVAEFVKNRVAMFSGGDRLPPEGLVRWADAMMANPGRAWRAGVRLGVGSDSGPGSEPMPAVREIELFVKSGVPAAEALKAATANGAEILGVKDSLGRIRAGFDADLIAVAGNPVEDVSRLRTVSFVMKDGKVQRNEQPPSK